MTGDQVTCYRAQDHAEPVPEARARDALNYAVWGGELSLDQFLAREARLWRHPFSQRGLRLWLLRRGDEVLASCETYAISCQAGEQSGVAHGIASVFVEQRLRGQGHASALLRGVNARLHSEGALCTYLMSEVEPTIYARLGFVARPLRCQRFSAQHGAPPAAVEWLALDRLDPSLLPAWGDALSLRLDPDFVRWHIERGWFHADALGRPRQRILGPRVCNSWAICADEPGESLLRVLALRSDGEPQALAQVIAAARWLAAQQGLSTVEIWQNQRSQSLPFPIEPASEALDVIPMLCPLQPGMAASDWQSCERGHWI